MDNLLPEVISDSNHSKGWSGPQVTEAADLHQDSLSLFKGKCKMILNINLSRKRQTLVTVLISSA